MKQANNISIKICQSLNALKNIYRKFKKRRGRNSFWVSGKINSWKVIAKLSYWKSDTLHSPNTDHSLQCGIKIEFEFKCYTSISSIDPRDKKKLYWNFWREANFCEKKTRDISVTQLYFSQCRFLSNST